MKLLKKETVLELNIPPLWSCCMSSCNQNCNTLLLLHFSKTSARTSNLFLFLFATTAILGFLMRNLYLRLMRALLSFLFFLFNFQFFLYHRPKTSWTRSFMIIPCFIWVCGISQFSVLNCYINYQSGCRKLMKCSALYVLDDHSYLTILFYFFVLGVWYFNS